MGASQIIAVDRVPERMERLGASDIVDFSKTNQVEEIMRITDGRGGDVGTEALRTQATFETCLRVLRPGTLSSLGVYSSDLRLPLAVFVASLGDHRIMSTLCSGGKDACGGSCP